MNKLFITLEREINDLRMKKKVQYDSDSLERTNEVNYKELSMYEKALDDVTNILKKYLGVNLN